MRARQSLLIPIVTVDIEPTEPIHALELAEAIEWDFAGSSDELKELSSLFFVEGADGTPEPLDL